MRVPRVVALLLAALLGAMALLLLVGPLLPEPEGAIHDGFTGVALFWGLAFAYGAAAVLQDEYQFSKRWRPGWAQGLGVTWFGGWTLAVVLAVIRLVVVSGPVAVKDFIGGALLLLGLFVIAPLVGGWMLARRRPRYRGWLPD
jgi:hypothetical protein